MDLLMRPPLQALCNVSCSVLGIVVKKLFANNIHLFSLLVFSVSARYLEQEYVIEHKTA